MPKRGNTFFKTLYFEICEFGINYTIFATHNGDVAQLARALAWHARGRGFDSHLLHF
jgi:hypothetical protein